jgi:membrane protein DedA with SNARE-associated domain
MQALLDFLVRHGYLVVFVWVLIAQAGLPLPALPVLIAAGALAGMGKLEPMAVVLLSLAASLISDAAWFQLGRRRGGSVLKFLCRVSLEPESCVKRTEDTFARRGGVTVVFAKFVPGLNTVAPPLAGMAGMTWPRFLWLDGAGAVLWTLAAVVPGYLFSDELERVAEAAALTGAWVLGILGAIVVLYVLAKFVARQRLLRRLRVARVTPEELHGLLRREPAPFVVDLRGRIHVAADPHVIPGALLLNADELDGRHAEIPRDRDVVIYCA